MVSGVKEEVMRFETRVKVADTTNTRRYVNGLEVVEEPEEDREQDLERYLEGVGDAQDGVVGWTALQVNRWMPLVHYD